MSITRWDPMSEAMSLREAMDSLLQESVVRPRGMGRRDGSLALALDVEEREDDYVVTAPIPGMPPEDVEITVLGDTLRIRAERKDERREEGDGKRWLLREQRYGAFERMVTLPSSVKADQANAAFQDGILTITLPKAEEAKAKQIPVQAGSRQGQAAAIEAGSTRGKQDGQQGGQQRG